MGRPGETAERWGCRLQRTCRGLRGWREVRQGEKGHTGTEREIREQRKMIVFKKT